MRDAAFEEHGHDRRHHPQCDIAHDGKIAHAVAVIGVEPRGRVRREDKDQLMKIVRQHQQQKQRCGDIKKARPFWQPVIFRLSQRERDEHAQKRKEQHRKVIAIPEIPDGGRRGGKEEFDGADGQPEYAQRRRRRQIPPHLRLNDPLPERNAPPGHETDINEAPQQRHWQKIRRLPMPARNDPRSHSADDQKRRNAAGQDLPFFLRRHKITCPHGFLYAKHTIREKPIARKAAISIPLARFSGIGIAGWDPMWYAGQEENWKNRGLGKEWAA